MITSKQSSIRLLVILLVAVIGAIFLNKYVIKKSFVFYPKFFVNLSSSVFVKIENFGGFLEKIENFNRLASENDKLKQDIAVVSKLEAEIDDLKSENEFLRRSVGISNKLAYQVVYAGIFNLNLGPTGYNVLLNKGSSDNISEGDIVITAEGEIVGKTQKVMNNFSRVLFVSDPEFKITAKVMGSDTSGISRGAFSEGVYLDFVIQEDEIKEGDIVISTGNDLFPPALVLGSVDHVESSVTQMFKKVRIRPAIKEIKLGRVLVIKIKQ